MIDIRTENGSANATMTGSVKELYADAMVIVNTLYHSIRDEDAVAGEMFRFTLQHMNLAWEAAGSLMELRVPNPEAKEGDA